MRALIALTVAACPAVAAAADLSVKLRDGATWTQTIVNTRTDSRNPEVSAITATTILHLTYHTHAHAPATIEETFVSFKIDGAPPEQAAAVANQAKVIYPAVIEVDDGLVPVRVVGWPQMRETLFKSMEASVDAKGMAGVRATFGAMDEKAAAGLFKEQAMVALGQGGVLDLGKTQDYTGSVPNPLGGPAIRSTGAFRLEALDTKAGRATVSWTQTLDPKSAADSIRATAEMVMQKVAPADAEKARAQFASATFTRQDDCRYDIDLKTGLATKADCTVGTNIAVGGESAQRTDHWVITQSPPETH